MKIQRRLHIIFTATSFLIGGTLGGCGQTAYGPAANRSVAQALSFRPPAGQSGIYVIRQSGFVGGAVAWTILLDVDQLGMVSTDHYLYGTVPPGDHNLTMTVQTNNGHTFHTEADKNYFFKVTPGLEGGNFEQLSEERGRQLVTEIAGK